MNISLDVEIRFDAQAVADKTRADELWLFAAKRWYGIYLPYVPYDTGKLASQVEFAPGTVTHSVPYAKEVYYSGGGYSAGRPLAGAFWDRAAFASGAGEIVSAIQGFVDGGALGLAK